MRPRLGLRDDALAAVEEHESGERAETVWLVELSLDALGRAGRGVVERDFPGAPGRDDRHDGSEGESAAVHARKYSAVRKTLARTLRYNRYLTMIPQAGQKGPDARRRPKVAREAYSLYVERATEGANEADGPFSAA